MNLAKRGMAWLATLALLFGVASMGVWGKTSTTKIYQAIELSYSNPTYGLKVALPPDWFGCTVLESRWQGINTSTGKTHTGAQITLRHPKWSQSNPRQDLPILVCTASQWKQLQRETLAIGAAPMPPTELARNNRYVFALPARYNYAFLRGYQEVADLLANHAVSAYVLAS